MSNPIRAVFFHCTPCNVWLDSMHGERLDEFMREHADHMPPQFRTPTAPSGHQWCPHVSGFGPPFPFCLFCRDLTADAGLSLLIIDLGDCCVVRLEHGSERSLLDRLFDDQIDTHMIRKTFADLKAALDGEKPVPRIEVEPKDDDNYYHRYRVYTEAELPYPLNGLAYDALSQLAGHSLPIYKGGKWTTLLEVFEPAKMPFRAYRYTR